MKRCPVCDTIYDEQGPDVCPEDGAELKLDTVDDNFLGRTLSGRFKIETLIGAGGMGRVYRARQLSVDRAVAVKILHREALLKKTATQRFLLEAKATSQLTNPHTVTLYDYGETDDGLPFIVMEYLEGRSLKERMLASGTTSFKDALRILSEVCESLAEAHRRNIVHRDLKPDNIFLAKTDEADEFVKVLDFGIARAKSVQDVETLTRTGTVAGTPAYVAPEALLGEDVSPSADVYALGLVLFEMCAGYHPFTADTAFKVMRHHLETTPPPLTRAMPEVDLPRGLSDLVAMCLAKKPLQRPQDAAALKVQLDNIAAGRGFLTHSSVSTDTIEVRAITSSDDLDTVAPPPAEHNTGDAMPMATNAALHRPVPPSEMSRRPRLPVFVGVAVLALGAVGAVVLMQDPDEKSVDVTEAGVDVAAEPKVTPSAPAASKPAAPIPAKKAVTSVVPTPPVEKKVAAPTPPPKVPKVPISISSD
ncbi:MAG: serine/threonine-protein kinase, partial [Myxococcota bacterium]|nr:serine/threonine-protein kinase [Myxococcota bacterium]